MKMMKNRDTPMKNDGKKGKPMKKMMKKKQNNEKWWTRRGKINEKWWTIEKQQWKMIKQREKNNEKKRS